MAASRTPLIVALATVTAACALFAVVAAITSDDDDSAASPPPGATPEPAAEISIQEFVFGPPEVQVAAGDSVRWTNLDGFAHSVRAGDQSFVSETLDQGDSFSFTFAAAGSFAYICGIHPSMTGTVVVG